MSVGTQDIFLPYGGNTQFDSRGDLVVATDTSDTAAATNQRIIRLLFTRARQLLAGTNTYTAPDDIYNPDWGAGLGALVHRTDVATNPELAASLAAAMLADPGVAPQPAPVVSFTTQPGAPNIVYVTVTYTNVLGQRQTIPPTPITS